mgnify:CR=1 FL=1
MAACGWLRIGVESIEAMLVQEAHARKTLRPLAQHGIEPLLRADLQIHRAVGVGTLHPPRRALDILFRASTLGVEAHGRTVLRRPPSGLVVAEVEATAASVTTFSVDRAATGIDEGYRAALAGLER